MNSLQTRGPGFEEARICLTVKSLKISQEIDTKVQARRIYFFYCLLVHGIFVSFIYSIRRFLVEKKTYFGILLLFCFVF